MGTISLHRPPSSSIVRPSVAGALALGVLSCGEPRRLRTDLPIETATAQLLPAVERAVGLRFKRAPAIAKRSPEQVRAYLRHKLDADLPPDEVRGITLAYRLFGFIADTLDLRALLLALYTEQVAGYYDPDSATLYVVAGTDPVQVRLVLAHELVHALQGQYLNLDSLLKQPGENDRHMAAQAVLEGQATLASLSALSPEQSEDSALKFQDFRRMVRDQQARMPVLGSAPAIVQEDLIFPYLAGADFVRWFERTYQDTVPFGRRLPQSTEQILHPARYREGDAPVALRFRSNAGAIYQDGLGEFETRVLLAELSGSESVGALGASGWAGDRYGVFPSAAGYALVWWTVWDTEKAAQRFGQLLEREWVKRQQPGRRGVVMQRLLGTRSAVELIDAPLGWAGWRAAPEVETP